VEPEVDIPRLVRLVESGAINRKLLLGKWFAFEEVNEALLALSSEDPGRPVIGFSA
jgi:Zn-dependent alcohol dehydrogenase